MSEFIPPFPKRHAEELSPIQTILHARRDLLSIWTESAFKHQFMRFKIFNKHIFIANHPDLVKHVFVSNNAKYEKKSPQMRRALEPLLGNGLFISDGEIWHTARKLQTPLFTNAKVIEYSELMVETALERVEKWQSEPNNSELMVLPEMAQLTSEIISRVLFGRELGDHSAETIVTSFAQYQDAIEQMAVSSLLGLPDWLTPLTNRLGRARRSAKKIHNIVDGIIEEAKKEDDATHLLAHLLAANKMSSSGIDKQGIISEEQIRNELIVLFMAGHETTANTLAWFWYLISQSPDVEERIHQELDQVLGGRVPTHDDVNQLVYIKAAIEETMRLYPPVPILSRQSVEDDVIRRRKVPEGSVVLVVPWLLHRHKEFWDKPDHFIPERFLPGAGGKHNKYTYVPFSLGPRVCLGKMFGMVEMILVVAILMQRFRLVLPKGTEVRHDCRLTLRPKDRLPMTLIHR